jgi:hypothetical protein
MVLKNQLGLRINSKVIGSREDLEIAFQLLQAKENPKNFSIVSLAFYVLIAYSWKISRPRKTSINSLLVLQATPQNIISQKCSYCQNRVLDDPLAYYVKSNPTFYVRWVLGKTCGLPGCPRQGATLIPFNSSQKYIKTCVKDILELENRKKSTWQSFFLH